MQNLERAPDCRRNANDLLSLYTSPSRVVDKEKKAIWDKNASGTEKKVYSELNKTRTALASQMLTDEKAVDGLLEMAKKKIEVFPIFPTLFTSILVNAKQYDRKYFDAYSYRNAIQSSAFIPHLRVSGAFKLFGCFQKKMHGAIAHGSV